MTTQTLKLAAFMLAAASTAAALDVGVGVGANADVNTDGALPAEKSTSVEVGTPVVTDVRLGTGANVNANGRIMVGGAPMLPSYNIVQNASHSRDHTILVNAVEHAGLNATLESPGPFTVFAPTNAAFNALPRARVETLMRTENRAQLSNLLKYHVVAGSYSSGDIATLIKNGGGKATLTTIQGEPLTASMNASGDMVLTDAQGRTSVITTADVPQSNGTVHVVNSVMMPGQL